MAVEKRIVFWILFAGFLLGGINHFADTEFYFQFMHYILPRGHGELKEQLIYISGATEILAALLFIIPKTRQVGAKFILLHLLVFLPIHIAMCFMIDKHNIPWYGTWGRLMVQFVLIYWAATFTEKRVNQTI